MAVHTKWCDAIATIFTAEKFCENFINEDNFNNTFLIKKSLQTTFVEWSDANIIKRCDILSIKRIFLMHKQKVRPSFENRTKYIKSSLDYFTACWIATATATVAPTIGLLPIPRKPIISTCAGTDDEPANCASECIRPRVSVIP